ncbi:related to PPR1 - Zinc finger transcription factor [Ustilago trichophora]|uniref:Related to PPR1 - Zinc finger transcription factor n=1 Tax=Ustilago trichophora TaxID=86804 RepID=A0A5C3DY02_9BASI|nr:related to PPR1 - Zinc finger transcription factor [Ustilago trichophora]
MSTGGPASAAGPGQDSIHPAAIQTSDDVSSHSSSPMNSAKARRNSPARASASTSDIAGPSRSSPKTVSTSRADKERKQDRERSASKDNEKARDKEKETRLPACEACRTRKVKCDALLPACTPCQKSGRECFGRDKIPNVSRGLVYELQQKVKDLESRLALASSGAAINGHSTAHGDDGSDNTSGSGSRTSRAGRPPAKRTKRGRNGHPSFGNGAQSADSDQESSSSDSDSSSPGPIDPSPNDFIQQTSTILESLSSDLTGSAHRHHQPTLNRPTTQTLDDDEASALAALTKHHRDRTKSPSRLKRRSSSNASRYRDDASSYFSGTSRFKDASAPFPFKSRSRPGRIGTISAYERTFFDRLIARYLTYMNAALPVINEVRMWEMATLVYQDDERSRLASLSATPFDSMPPPPIPPSPVVDRITLSKHRYLVLMALAIALASLGRSHNFSPELRRLGHQYWAEAQAMFPLLFRFGDIDKLRATLLQLQYALLVPSAGSVWELSGAAIRLVTELNLHVDREYDSAANAPFSQEVIDLRRRLFWTTYCLDRSLAVALARPPGLSDAWIHVQLPSLLSDPDLLRSDREIGSSSNEHSRIDSQKQLFRSHINLRRVQSEILCRLHSVNPRDYSLDNDGVSLSQPASTRPSLALVMEVGPPTPNIEWQSRMMEKLIEWRSEYDRIRFAPPTIDRSHGDGVSSTATPFITRDWIDLNHNLTISLLFRPSPNNPRPDSHGLQQAFMASGRAMKIYKGIHRSSTINFPWLATHHLFISGLTHLNALEKLTRTGISCPSPVVEVVFNVQSCASTLEALTSRDDGYGTRIRDTFDAAASAVLRSVLDPGSTRQASSSTDGSASDIASVEDFIRGSSSLHGRQAEQNRSTPLPEGSSLRRTSHHEMMQAAAHQHPTWLSDSTWSSINTLDAAPPPGSTIFVAAPPRTARFGTPGHSLVPTLSERTTQSVQPQPSPLSAPLQPSGTHSPRSFGMHQPSYSTSLTPTSLNFAASVSAANSDPFGINSSSDTSSFDASARTQKDGSSNGGAPEEAERAVASTFGFHNWLLQPYEGGADASVPQFGMSNGTNPFGSSAGSMLFGTNSPSAGYGGDPFSHMYSSPADPMLTRAGMNGVVGQAAHMGTANTNPTKGAAVTGPESDASTLLDFLSMLPGTAPAFASPGGKANASNGSPATHAKE